MKHHELNELLRHLFRYHARYPLEAIRARSNIFLPLHRVAYPSPRTQKQQCVKPIKPIKSQQPIKPQQSIKKSKRSSKFKQETKWKNIPETPQAFCAYWKTHHINDKERKRLFDLLHKRALELGFDEQLDHMSPDLLMRLFALVDTMWLGGIVAKVLVKQSIGASFGTSPLPRPGVRGHPGHRGVAREPVTTKGKHNKRVAGFCRLAYLGALASSLRINMCKAVLCHPDLFRTASSPRTYQVGGVLCSSPLQCMLQVFVHEFVHALVGIFCVEKAQHGPRFRRILKAMFGQTTHVAGLSNPLTKTYSGIHKDEAVKLLKRRLKHGDQVTFYTSLKTKKKRGIFLGLTYKHKEVYAKVKHVTSLGHKTIVYTVPLIYLTLVDS